MDNIIVYCEVDENRIIDISLELLTKGRSLANELGCKLEAVVIGSEMEGVEQQAFPYGVDRLYIANHPELYPYRTLPHAAVIAGLFKEIKPQIALFGATAAGRDIAPRIASLLKCGLTADCTSLEIGDHEDKKAGKTYTQLLYQIRPAFGGNIIATIINPQTKPQMATVREGVMKKETVSAAYTGEIIQISPEQYLTEEDFHVKILDRQIEAKKIDIKSAPVIIAGGYGAGSKESFNLLFELADALGGEVAGSRAAVDAGFIEHERQVGQTGVTVRPKLYIACGISGAVQHRAGMDKSAMIISVNTDKEAPINTIADYTIIGDINDVIPKMIKYYKKNSK